MRCDELVDAFRFNPCQPQRHLCRHNCGRVGQGIEVFVCPTVVSVTGDAHLAHHLPAHRDRRLGVHDALVGRADRTRQTHDVALEGVGRRQRDHQIGRPGVRGDALHEPVRRVDETDSPDDRARVTSQGRGPSIEFWIRRSVEHTTEPEENGAGLIVGLARPESDHRRRWDRAMLRR